MIKALVVILLIAGFSLYFTDLESESVVASVLLPIALVIALIAFTLWLVTLFHRRGISQSASRGAGGAAGFFDDGAGGGDGS